MRALLVTSDATLTRCTREVFENVTGSVVDMFTSESVSDEVPAVWIVDAQYEGVQEIDFSSGEVWLCASASQYQEQLAFWETCCERWFLWPADEMSLKSQLSRGLRQFHRKSEDRHRLALYEKILEDMNQAVEIASDDFRLEYVNPAFSRIFGFSPEEVLKHTPKELMRSGLHEPEHFAEMEKSIFSNGHWKGRLIGRRKDNSLSFSEVEVGQVPSPLGDRSLLYALKQDMLRLHPTFQPTSPDLRGFEELMRISRGAMLICNPDGEILDCNERAAELLDCQLEDLHQKTYDDIDAELNHSFLRELAEFFQPETFHSRETTFRRGDAELPVLARYSVFTIGQRAFLLILFQDITPLRIAESKLKKLNKELEAAIEEAERANRTKSVFLASMSHEIRTPLNAIIGYSQLLQEEMYDAEHTMYAEDMKRVEMASALLLSLINDILDLSKIEANQVELLEEQIHVSTLFDESITSIQPVLQKKGLELSIELAQQDMSFSSDRNRVRQIIINLLSNACKFTEQGEVSLRASFEGVGDEHIVFEVADTGIGIPLDMQAHLFDPFVRVNTQHHRKEKGTGLGLAICHSLCELLGGEISVESQPGEGATFRVVFPRQPDFHREEKPL